MSQRNVSFKQNFSPFITPQNSQKSLIRTSSRANVTYSSTFDVSFQPGGQLNNILTETLHQAKNDLKQLSQLTKQKWGKKALLFQAQSQSLEGDARSSNEKVTISDTIRIGNNTKIRIPKRLRDRKKIQDIDSRRESNSVDDSMLFDSNGKFRMEDFASSLNENNDEPRKEEDEPRSKKRSENKPKIMVEISNMQESMQATKGQRDYELLNQLIDALNEKEQQKKRKVHTNSQFTDVYDRTKQLLEELWDEMQVPMEERKAFGRLAFSSKSIGNCALIFDEFSRLCSVRSLHHQVLTKIEMREVLLKRLQKLDVVARNGTSASVLDEVTAVIGMIRETSIELIESIHKWREAHRNPKIFSWENENYMMKIRTDLNWLKMSTFCQYFPFNLEDNPLLLLNNLRCERIRKLLAEKPVKKNRHLYLTTVTSEDSSPTTTSTHISFHSSNKIRYAPDNDGVREDIKKISNLFLAPFENLSKEEIERYQRVEGILEDEVKYAKKLATFEKRFKAACKIQGVVRTMLAVKEANERRRIKESQEFHRKIMLARLEYEQQQRKEESRQLKRNSITQLISQLDDDTTFVVPSNLVNKIPLDIDAPNYNVKDSLFENSFIEYHKNGRYKAKILLPEGIN